MENITAEALTGAYPDRIALYADEDDFGRLHCANDIWLDATDDAREISQRTEVRYYIPEADLLTARSQIEALEAAIKRQSGAGRTIQQTTAMIAQNENQRLRDIDRSEYIASATLDSERNANAILTEELARAEAERDAALARVRGLEEAVRNALAAGLPDVVAASCRAALNQEVGG